MLGDWHEFELINYQVHMGELGWLPVKKMGEIAGNQRRSFDIQAIRISSVCKVYYSVYSSKYGWSEDKSENQMAGSTGLSEPLLRVKIRVGSPFDKIMKVVYRLHGYDKKWSEWFNDGQSASLNDKPFNAIQIKIDRLFDLGLTYNDDEEYMIRI